MREMPARLAAFAHEAPPASMRALSALAAPESLTDELACRLVELACPGQLRAKAFVAALHVSGFLVERNSEWHLSREERAFLQRNLASDRPFFSACHALLAEIADAANEPAEPQGAPVYLLGPVGKAYHHAALSAETGLRLYRETSFSGPAQQWLAARMAGEQQDQGILPPDAIEPRFLQGMVLYREGERPRAMQALRPVAYSGQEILEVAVAAHLYGRDLWRRDPPEAERLLRRSLEILVQIRNRHGEAQVLHTLGKNLWKSNPAEAERLLRRSLEIGAAIGHRHHQAQVLHTFGQNLWRSNPAEAKRLLRRSLVILEQIRDRHGEAQVLHTLGSKLPHGNSGEAEAALRRSLDILQALGDLRGQAMVFLTLGKLRWPVDEDAGRALMLSSLEIERQTRNWRGEDIVLRELRKRGIGPPAG